MSKLNAKLDKVALDIVQVRRKLRVFRKVLPTEVVELELRHDELQKEYKELKQQAVDKIIELDEIIKKHKAHKRSLKNALKYAERELDYERN